MGWESSDVVRFDLGPWFKVLITCLLLDLEVCSVKPTYRKSWAGNLLMWSDLTLDPSFKVKQGKPKLKVFITCLLLVLEVWEGEPTYRKSWLGIFWCGRI